MLWALILILFGAFLGFIILSLLNMVSEGHKFKDNRCGFGDDERHGNDNDLSIFENIIYLGTGSKKHKRTISKISTKKGRIMFVNDEEHSVGIIDRMLSHLGYEVAAYNSSLEALNCLKSEKQKYDLIITDYIMPVLSGIELAKEAKRLQPEVPVILFTGFSDIIPTEKINELCIQEVVAKPINLDNLAKVVSRFLNPAKVLSPPLRQE